MTPSPKHSLLGLLVAQFCGAFNDNAWKLIVALLAIHQISLEIPPGPAFETAAQAQTTKTFVIFTLPLMLVSFFSGIFSDRNSKRTIIILMKGLEVLLMAAGTMALFAHPAGDLFALVVLALMGVQSALFSPSKYGILPEILPHQKLSIGNGRLELWTFVAIIAGTAAAGPLLSLSGHSTWLAGLSLTIMSIFGFFASLMIPPVPVARTEGGLLYTVTGAWSAIRGDRILRLAIIGAILFWTLASLVGQDILVYAKAVLKLSDSTSGIPMAVLAMGIGAGSILAGRLSSAKVEYGLLPLGAIGLTFSMLLIGLLTPQLPGTLLCMFLLGIGGGLVVVPINALIQWRAPQDRRGAVIALSNTMVFAGVLIGSLSGGTLAHAGFSSAGIMLAASVGTGTLTLWALWLMPQAFVRLCLVLLTNTFYRLKIVGQQHLPTEGGFLLVPNHVSFIDGLLLVTSLDRPIRFIVDSRYYHHPLLRPLAKIMQAIPISSSGAPREILHALRLAGRLLDEGEVVCIFPEGQITRTGGLLPFRSGFERILKGRETPIIPVHLDRVWGSIFSFIKGRFITKWPDRIPFPVTVSFGQPLPATTSATEVRSAVQALGEEAWMLRRSECRPLHHSFIRAMRRHPFQFAFGDQTKPHVSCWQALVGSLSLARALKSAWKDQPTIGILLPPSVAGALVNFAATIAGHTVVNLNYTAGKSGMEAAAEQAGLTTVVTSQLFIKKAKLEFPDGVTPIWLEDIRKTLGPGSKVIAILLTIFAPISLIERLVGNRKTSNVDDVATIIFSSGSTGTPKGVMLTHFNIDSNLQAVVQLLHVGPGDKMLGILPFFHSFGYLATLWLSAIQGVGVVYHPSPLDAGPIGEQIHKYRVTILITTPTFLQLYLRRCTPDQFGSLRVLLTGAEKLSERLAQAVEDQFGIRPIEGYGATECSPVISVNCPDFRAAGFYQPASKRGTVGYPLPGVATKVVDPETYQPLPAGTAGMLLVKGPNVMKGYLNREDLTAKAMHEGWYITGDIAFVDEEGFLHITDRLSRFSKIGGEMVPHGTVEESLHQTIQSETQVFAVTGVPDEKKGEQLAVLHTLDPDNIPEILETLSTMGLPNLFLPRRDHFVKVETIPVLGTGKLDLREIKRVAMEQLQAHVS